MIEKESSLVCLGISWKGFPKQWSTIPLSLVPVLSVKGEVYDSSGSLLYRLRPLKELGRGQFGRVDAFLQECADGRRRKLALKRPLGKNLDLKLEALFQWALRKELEEYGVEFCIPEVYGLVRFHRCEEVWFTMEAFEPLLLNVWCERVLSQQTSHSQRLFPLLLLQIALILQLLENELLIDHRDLKVNNILVVEKPVTISFQWKAQEREYTFPFHVVFLDFGYACVNRHLDIREVDGLPSIHACPNPGRDVFQVLVSLWRIQCVRTALSRRWGRWIERCLQSITPAIPVLKLLETRADLDWMYMITDTPHFSAPECAPKKMIEDCLAVLEGE